MYKTAVVVLAALSLSACASLAPIDALNAAPPSYAKSNGDDSDGGSGEPVVVMDRAAEMAPEAMMTSASPAVFRRSFGHPTRRQPDLRLVLATATDRARIYRRRVRRGRA